MNERFNGGGYSILLHEVPCVEGRMRPGHLLVRDSAENLSRVGIPSVPDKPFLPLLETLWVAAEHRGAMEAGSIPFMEPTQMLSYHIALVLRKYAEEFIGIQETRFLLSRMEARFPDLVKEAQRVMPLQKIAEILQRLVSEERVGPQHARDARGADRLGAEGEGHGAADRVRPRRLKRHISYRYSSGLNMLPAYLLTPELEDTVRGRDPPDLERQLPRARPARHASRWWRASARRWAPSAAGAQAGAAHLHGHPALRAAHLEQELPSTCRCCPTRS